MTSIGRLRRQGSRGAWEMFSEGLEPDEALAVAVSERGPKPRPRPDELLDTVE